MHQPLSQSRSRNETDSGLSRYLGSVVKPGLGWMLYGTPGNTDGADERDYAGQRITLEVFIPLTRRDDGDSAPPARLPLQLFAAPRSGISRGPHLHFHGGKHLRPELPAFRSLNVTGLADLATALESTGVSILGRRKSQLAERFGTPSAPVDSANVVRGRQMEHFHRENAAAAMIPKLSEVHIALLG